MYLWNVLWNSDDTEMVPIQCRRDCFATLDVWQAFGHICTSGIYSGTMTTPRRLPFNVEGKVVLPLMCGKWSARDAPLEYTLV